MRIQNFDYTLFYRIYVNKIVENLIYVLINRIYSVLQWKLTSNFIIYG